MDKLIPSLYKNYGKYVNQFRSFPLNTDGLKPVERRVLLSAYQVARDKFVKSVKVDGHTLGNYHPHSSAYGTIVQLVNNNFLDGQGNYGSNVGTKKEKAAAPRYTECKLSKKTLDLSFKLINYVDWVESELENEPEYLPTMFPFCLLGTEACQGIGFGYRTFIPSYTIKDLYKRLLWLIGKTKTKPIIKPITDCEILSSDLELDEILTTGKGNISIKGILQTDLSNYKVTLKSWAPDKLYESIRKKISKYFDNQDIGEIDLSSNETRIVFEVIKQRNKDKIFEKFVEDLQRIINGNISYICTVVDNEGNVKVISVDDLLLNTYNMYTKINEKMLQQEIDKNNEIIKEYRYLEKLRPFLSKHLKNITNDIDIIINSLSKDTNIEYEIIKNLFSKHKINKLLTLNTDQTVLNKRIYDLETNLKDINSYVLEQYKGIIKINE